MKKLLLLTSLAALVAAPATARAGDDEAWAAIGGFIGGVIVGSHLDNHRHREPAYCPPPARGGTVIIIDNDRPSRREPRGCWREVSVKTWVPARWVIRIDSCGRRVGAWEGGHHEYRTERVWVDYARRDNGRRYGHYRD